VEKDAAILNQLEEDARSLIKVIGEKRKLVHGSLLGCRRALSGTTDKALGAGPIKAGYLILLPHTVLRAYSTI
jgi:hypothetical protein